MFVSPNTDCDNELGANVESNLRKPQEKHFAYQVIKSEQYGSSFTRSFQGETMNLWCHFYDLHSAKIYAKIFYSRFCLGKD